MSREDHTACVAALRDALPADRVQDGADVLRHHARDASFHEPAAPDAVAFPETPEEAAIVVRTCAAHGTPMVPFGVGTALEGHVAAVRGGVSIDTSRLTEIRELSVEDMDVVVQAGVTRRQLDQRLRPEGVFFTVDPGADATIGGMIATGASGTTTVRYGAMRENVLSLLVVTPDGELVRTGSRARKSSAGYDLTRLFIGSEGTLGLVVEATLRVRPTPEAMAAATCTFPSLEAATACVADIAAHAIPVARIELADELLVDAMIRMDGIDAEVAPTLFLELHGTPDEVAAQVGDVRELAEQHGASRFAEATDEAQRRALWSARHRAFEAVRHLAPGHECLTTDVCVPISALAEQIVAAQGDLREHGLHAGIVGHVGDGNFHAIVLVDPEDPSSLEAAEAFHARLVRRAIAADGTCTGEHGVGSGKARFLVEEHGEAAVGVMRALKAALDPDGLFNPGKVTDAPDLLAPA